MFIEDLVFKLIIIAESLYKALKKKRVRKFFNKFLEDTDILNIYTKKWRNVV